MYLKDITNTGFSFDIESIAGSATEMRMSSDGSRLWVVNLSTSVLYEIVLTTHGTLADGATIAAYSVSFTDQEPFVYSFDVVDDRYIYAVGLINDTIYQYEMNTIGTIADGITYLNKSLDVNPPEASVTSLLVTNGGASIFFGGNNDVIYEWTMSTTNDLDTASDTGRSFNVSSEALNSRILVMEFLGTKLLYAGGNVDRVFEYDVSNAYTLNPAPTYTNNFWNLSSIVADPVGLAPYNNNKLFLLADTDSFPSTKSIFEFDFDPDLPDVDTLTVLLNSNIVETVTLDSETVDTVTLNSLIDEA